MASSSGGLVVNDPQKFVDSLLNDLRSLSTEARRKHESVKDAAESAIVKVRNISTSSEPKILQANLRNACNEILHPLVLGCSTKTPKLVQISLQSIQRALQFGVINEGSSPIIVRELWNLTEAECEELKVLQTITLFVSSGLLVTGSSLSKCIVLAIKLNFSKDPSVINAASAAVRQLFSCTFERVVQEDGIKSLPILQFPIPENIDYTNIVQSEDLSTKMGACAADSLLLLKDLISLIRRQATSWLIGVKRFTITLALELLETIIKNYPSVFFHHIEHAVILRDLVCPELLFNLTGKKPTGSPTDKHYEKPPFPVLMRCLRIGLTMVKNYHEIIEYHCETFIEFVVHLLASRQAEWQSAAALEVIHKIVGQPELLRWLCSNFHLKENGPKLIEMIIRGVTNFSCRALRKAIDDEPMEVVDQNQPGFLCGETFIAIHENVSAKRWILLDWLEKHEAGNVPAGYCISLAYACLIDATHSIYAVVEEVNSPSKLPVKDQNEIELHQKVSNELFQCTANSLLHGLVQLLVVSVEDSVTESLLNCLSTVVILACKTGIAEIKDSSFRGLCRYALPNGYFDRFITINNAQANQNGNHAHPINDIMFSKDHAHSVDNIEMIGAKLDQVIAMGTVCPTFGASNTAPNENFSLTAKNMKVARILVSSTDTNGQYLTSTWDMILATLQHFTWVIGIKPLPNGGFRTVGDASGSESTGLANVNSGPTNSVLTTAVVGELPSFNQMLNKLMEHSSTYDDVSLHHVIASLCELSSDQMKVAQKSSKDISFFAISKLLQTSIVNLFRLDVFWRPITAHLVEVCSHSHTQLREWGSLALTQLVMSAMRQHIELHPTDTKRQILIMTPLSQLNEVAFLDVKQRQLDCVMNILEVASNTLCDEVWDILVGIVLQIAQDESSTERLIEYAHTAVSQIGKDFLDVLPFQCLKKYLHTVQMFGQQSKSINIALSSIGLLWHVSDQIRIRCQHHGEANIQEIWIVLFQCVGELCVDNRPAVRKSACDTLLQTVACHSDDLTPLSWHVMLTDILFTLLEKVRTQTKNASTSKFDDSTSGNQKFLVHHSRDTPAKQWAETTVRTLFGVVRIFNAQRHVLKQQDDFFDNWNRMIQYIEYTAMVDNPEISLAALKDFHEFHFGKVEDKPNEKEKASSNPRKTKKVEIDAQATLNVKHESSPESNSVSSDYESANTVSAYFRMIDIAPPLPDAFWIESWKSWFKIGKILTTPKVYGTENGDAYRFVPGPFHWTTYLQIFPSLFARVKGVIDSDDLKYNELLTILKKIASAPKSSDQAPFSLTTANPELSPAHEAILECIRILAREMTNKNSNHRQALPDLFQLLLDFTGFSLRTPPTDFVIAVKAKEYPSPMPSLSLAPFADICLKFVVEYFSKVATMREVIDGGVFVSIVRGLSDPLVLRYHCPTTAIWMNAVSAFTSICRVGLPIARENLDKFKTLWFPFITIIDKFLFCKNQTSKQLNAEERKRFEFVDCQIIELLRVEILPFASILPWEFMQRVIDILNKASINTLDPNDTFASDLCEQRTDLCKVSFDALLSLSQTQVPGEFLDMPNGKDGKKQQTLGAHAISSLLLRCKQVINAYARDAQSNGRIPLLSQRVYEVISVLRAISALIEGLNDQPKAVVGSFFDPLIDLYPNVVQMVSCCKNNADVQLAVMTTLNSYRTIMILNFSAQKQNT